MMTTTFDQAMGFPAGSSMQMGMYDGVAGIQGFTLKELQTGGTLGCNPFAGPVSFSPAPDMNMDGKPDQTVNNCMPNYAGMPGMEAYAGMINGTCTGAAAPNPGTCTGGFRNGGACMVNADCEGAMTDMAEIQHNPFGLILNRHDAVSHFKIDLQQSYSNPANPATSKVKWAVSGDKNPSNPTHVNSWDQAQYCYDYMGGSNPMTPAVVACTSAAATAMDGKRHIATAINANQLLGYTPQTLALLMNPGTAHSTKTYVAAAYLSALADTEVDLTVELNASRSECYEKVLDASGIETTVDKGCTYTFTTTGGTVVGGVGAVRAVTYPAEGDYPVSVEVCMADDVATPADESQFCDTATATAKAVVVEDPAATADFATAEAGRVVTLTAPALDASVVRAYIYWGDRKRTSVNDVTALSTGIAHTYAKSGSYNIRVELLDTNHISTSFTPAEDADLGVVLP
jgi:hypothetical protein